MGNQGIWNETKSLGLARTIVGPGRPKSTQCQQRREGDLAPHHKNVQATNKKLIGQNRTEGGALGATIGSPAPPGHGLSPLRPAWLSHLRGG